MVGEEEEEGGGERGNGGGERGSGGGSGGDGFDVDDVLVQSMISQV